METFYSNTTPLYLLLCYLDRASMLHIMVVDGTQAKGHNNKD